MLGRSDKIDGRVAQITGFNFKIVFDYLLAVEAFGEKKFHAS
jgi:hypothetical protein